MKNKTFCIIDVQVLTDQAIWHWSSEDWRKACGHVKKVEEDYWESDKLQDIMVHKLVIDIDKDNSERESEESDVSKEA